MNKENKDAFEKASKTPQIPLFYSAQAKNIIGKARVVRELEYYNVLEVFRDARNYRVYSYNDILKVMLIVKLMNKGFKVKVFKPLLEALRKREIDEIQFLNELLSESDRTKKYFLNKEAYKNKKPKTEV